MLGKSLFTYYTEIIPRRTYAVEQAVTGTLAKRNAHRGAWAACLSPKLDLKCGAPTTIIHK